MRNKRKRNHPLFEKVSVEKVAAKGKCIAYIEEKVLFIDGNVAPGDVVDVQVTKKNKKFFVGRPVHYHEYSERRTDPFCEHYGLCGGCKWQHIDYKEQLGFKYQEVIDALQRIGKISFPTVRPIVSSQKTKYYRNKLEYTFSNQRWLTTEEIEADGDYEMRALGFHVPEKFDKIVDIKHCSLQPEPSNRIRLAVRDYAFEHELTFFDLRQQVNLLRNLVIRTSTTGEIMVIVIFFKNDTEKINGLMEHLKTNFEEITSLYYIINQKKNDSYLDQNTVLYHGKKHLVEKMEDLQFHISPKAFYQTNPDQAYELYKITRELADLKGDELVYDLYTGTGTIANFVAKKAGKVIGIEYVASAIKDAMHNSKINGIENTAFFAGDMKDMLNMDFLETHGRPDVIITDPPRAGMHEDVINVILNASPQTIIYVSCNPATQARDLALLDYQYEVVAVQPVDMFPHTYHVENIVKLTKRI